MPDTLPALEYDPQLYRAVHRGNPGDLAFYEARCPPSADVLELGCGYGRVLARLASGARSVVGLDRDPGLLAVAREALGDRCELVVGDMTAFDLARRFDRILVPHSGLWCLPDDDAVRSCFASVRRHLAPEGRLILDAWAADGFHIEGDPADFGAGELDPVVTADVPGRGTLDVYERTAWDRDAQRLDVTYVHVRRDGGPTEEGTIRHRYLLRTQVDALLADSGFEVERLQGGFASEPYSPEAEVLVCLARPRTVT